MKGFKQAIVHLSDISLFSEYSTQEITVREGKCQLASLLWTIHKYVLSAALCQDSRSRKGYGFLLEVHVSYSYLTVTAKHEQWLWDHGERRGGNRDLAKMLRSWTECRKMQSSLVFWEIAPSLHMCKLAGTLNCIVNWCGWETSNFWHPSAETERTCD